MANNSELKNFTGAGAKSFEVTSASPHGSIVKLGGVDAYNGTSGDIEFTISKQSENSGGYKIVAKITIPVEGSRSIMVGHGGWPINDSNDKYKAVWTQAAGNVNVTYNWND